MMEPRLRKVTTLLDDARALLVDIVDERPSDATPRDYNHLDAARQFINSAVVYVESADGAAEGDPLMSRVADFEIKGATDRIIEQYWRVHFGSRQEDVDKALERLLEQIEQCSRAIEVAAQRHRIDVANQERSAAEERLEELAAVYVD